MKSVAIIGSGFSGLASAAVLASNGVQVNVYEKNAHIGGRARVLYIDDFTFDMGPSWYWMPDVFERFFEQFGYKASDFYELKKLSPSFCIFFGKEDIVDIPSEVEDLYTLFETIEKGSAAKLKEFMIEAAYKYDVGINKLVYKPGLSWLEFADSDIIKGVFRLQVFSSFSKHVRKYFKDHRLIALMEFPVLFLGAKPADTPALYSLMNYAGLQLGTWYPMGGFSKIIEAMKTVAERAGAVFHLNANVDAFAFNKGSIKSIQSASHTIPVDAVIASADYHHVEQDLLPEALRKYSEKYWNNRVFAPSSLIFYLGVKKKVKSLRHHNLFFDEDLDVHAEEIYDKPSWPSKPLFYVCCPSKTDPSVAPADCENIFILMPLAPGVHDDNETREKYFNIIMDRLEKISGETFRDEIIVKKSYCISDFKSDYNAYKGNAYGLANTLMQTAVLKPSMRNSKVENLFYTGQLTVPGPGVPPAIISGQVAASELLNYFKRHES